MADRRWTKEEEAELTRLFKRRLTNDQIAAAMGKTKKSIVTKRGHLGLRSDDLRHLKMEKGEPFVTWTISRQVELIRMQQAGKSVEECAARLGMTTAQVEARMRHVATEVAGDAA